MLEQMAGRTEPATANDLKSLVEASIPKVFWQFDFYDQARLRALERKMLNHFLFREIAMTPVSRWLYMFNSHLDTVLPYYSQLMEALSQKYDPLTDVDYTEETDSDESGSKQSSETSTKDITRKMLETGTDNTTETKTGKDTHGGTTTETSSDEINKKTTYQHTTNDSMTDTHSIDGADIYDLVNGHGTTKTTTDDTTVETTGRDTVNGDVNKSTENVTTQNDTPTTYLEAFLQNAYMTSANKLDGLEITHNTGTTQKTNQDRTRGTVTDTMSGDDTQTGTVRNNTRDQHTVATKDSANDTTNETGTTAGDKITEDNRTLDTTSSVTGESNRDIDRSETGKDTGSVQGNESDSREGHVTRRVKGKMGGKSYAVMLKEYLDNLANVEAMVIDEMEQFFMMLY